MEDMELQHGYLKKLQYYLIKSKFSEIIFSNNINSKYSTLQKLEFGSRQLT